jgi:hypothetical protein
VLDIFLEVNVCVYMYVYVYFKIILPLFLLILWCTRQFSSWAFRANVVAFSPESMTFSINQQQQKNNGHRDFKFFMMILKLLHK